MTATLTGPGTCANCGTGFDREALLAGDLDGEDVTKSAYVVIRGHKIAIPGLWWDRACYDRIESGEQESTLTLGSALAFLDDTWGPVLVMAGMTAISMGDDAKASLAATKLADVLEVSLILETVIEALNEGSDLSWLPECNGHSHGDQADRRSVAHLN
jgi:hypothetical protein